MGKNAVVEIIPENNKIKNLDILGVRFNKKSLNVKFSEAFNGQIVPVVFYHEMKKTKSPLEATFIKREYIPKELFTVGSEFTVVDNGMDIARGKIVKIY